MTPLLDAKELGAFIRAHYRESGDELFRMERLPLYNVPAQAAELARWRAGATEPDWAQKQPWLDTLAGEQRRGLVSRRVRVFSPTVSDDERMSCSWGYALNGHYEDIRVLHRGEHNIPEGLIDHDYWLINNQYAVPMTYSADGSFVGAETLPAEHLAGYIQDSSRAWQAAEQFHVRWERHDELRHSPTTPS